MCFDLVSLQRKFAFDNPNLLGVSEVESDTDDVPGDTARVLKKRKVGTVGGRIPKGEDFWGQVDAFFRKEVGAHGKNLAGPGWKSYV